MFGLQRQSVNVDSVNPRAEKHGSEKTVLAFDVFMTLNVSNAVLGFFDPGLKKLLFMKGDGPQGELLKDEDHLPALRFPKIGAVKWSEKFPGYTLRLHVGINDDSDIVLDEVELDRFSFDPKEGGSVMMRFRAVLHPTKKQTGPICELIQREVEVTAIPPKPAEQLNEQPKAEGEVVADGDPNAGFADAAAAAIQAHKDEKAGDRRPAGGRSRGVN